MQNDIITIETHPAHHTVGKDFAAYNGRRYLCDSYDPNLGYWMTQRLVDGSLNLEDRRNVSERAIGGTFYEIYKDDLGPDGIREFTALGNFSGPMIRKGSNGEFSVIDKVVD